VTVEKALALAIYPTGGAPTCNDPRDAEFIGALVLVEYISCNIRALLRKDAAV
jgi:hypothetical protein